jgi:hypothetical protein
MGEAEDVAAEQTYRAIGRFVFEINAAASVLDFQIA